MNDGNAITRCCEGYHTSFVRLEVLVATFSHSKTTGTSTSTRTSSRLLNSDVMSTTMYLEYLYRSLRAAALLALTPLEVVTVCIQYQVEAPLETHVTFFFSINISIN